MQKNKAILDPDIASLDAESVQQLNQLDKHHINIRRIVVSIASFVILAGGVFEIYVMRLLKTWEGLGEYAVFLAIAPILSITIIVTFLLIGAFKKSNDSRIRTPNLIQTAESVVGVSEE